MWAPATLLALLALLPVYAAMVNEPFYLTLFSRIMIYALAGMALNFIMGFGGMVPGAPQQIMPFGETTPAGMMKSGVTPVAA